MDDCTFAVRCLMEDFVEDPATGSANGTEKRGVTYRLKEIFLDQLRDDVEITEFYLPRDCPDFCKGCTVCFLKDEHLCKDAEYVQKIEKAMDWLGKTVETIIETTVINKSNTEETVSVDLEDLPVWDD